MKIFLKITLGFTLFSFTAVSSQAATISGHVRFEGQVPEAKTVSTSSDPACKRLHPNGIALQSIEVENGGLRNAFIYIEGEGLSTGAPATAVVVDQSGCQYSPHVAGIQVGQTLELVNSDNTLHNVHAVAKTNKEFNLGMPVKDMRIKRKFDNPEIMVRLKCEVHPWMSGYVGVLDHPYFAVSGAAGEYFIDNVPPGKYTLHVWHETLGKQSQAVEILGADDSAQANFLLNSSAA